jgi:hypothetical protein
LGLLAILHAQVSKWAQAIHEDVVVATLPDHGHRLVREPVNDLCQKMNHQSSRRFRMGLEGNPRRSVRHQYNQHAGDAVDVCTVNDRAVPAGRAAKELRRTVQPSFSVVMAREKSYYQPTLALDIGRGESHQLVR